MADNFTANAGSGGDTFAADDIGGVKFPRSKLVVGADGANDGDVSSANPMPVTGTLVATQGGSWNVGTVSAVSGTVAATQSGTWNVGTLSVVSGTVTTTGTLAATQSGTWNIGTVSAVSGTVTTTGTLTATQGGAWSVNPIPATSGGLTTARSLDLDESEEEIKATAGQVYGWNITNFATSTRYVKFYNATAASVTVGTTTPLFTLAIPGNASDDTMLAQALGGMGIAFDTAITWAATTGLADNDTGAPSANDVAGTVWYK